MVILCTLQGTNVFCYAGRLSASGYISEPCKKPKKYEKKDNVSQQKTYKTSLAIHGITFTLLRVSTEKKRKIWVQFMELFVLAVCCCCFFLVGHMSNF